MSPATYAVTLKLDGTGDPQTTTLRLPVHDRMYERFPRPAEDSPQTMRAVFQDYKPEKLPPEQAFRGMMFFESVDDPASQINWGSAWLAGKDSIPPADGVVFDETFALSRLLIAQKKYQEAADAFKLAAAKNVGMEVRTNLMRNEVITLCDQVDDAATAVKEATDWQKKIPAGNRQFTQAQQAALAYALIAKGDGKAAKTAIDAAVAASPAGTLTGDAYNRQQIRQGVLTRNVEEYIRTKDYPTAATLLNEWELEFPGAIWEGFTRTLRVKLFAAQGDPAAAARTAIALARANPDGFYAAELLFRAAENFKTAGQTPQAQAAMDLLKTKYPESPYARDAN